MRLNLYGNIKLSEDLLTKLFMPGLRRSVHIMFVFAQPKHGVRGSYMWQMHTGWYHERFFALISKTVMSSEKSVRNIC